MRARRALTWLRRPGPSLPSFAYLCLVVALFNLLAAGSHVLCAQQGHPGHLFEVFSNGAVALCLGYHAWRWWPRHLAPCPRHPGNRRLWGHMPCDCGAAGGGPRA